VRTLSPAVVGCWVEKLRTSGGRGGAALSSRSVQIAVGPLEAATAWALLLARGLRRGELCGLEWQDVDLDAGTLRIVRTRVIADNRPVESLPKTAASRRAIPLDQKLVALLRRHRTTQAAERLAAGSAYEDGGWPLADELGGPYYPDSISGMFD